MKNKLTVKKSNQQDKQNFRGILSQQLQKPSIFATYASANT